jgi:hypothetical protein
VKCSREQLSAFLDGDLSERKLSRVRAHLDGCQACRRELEALKEMRVGLSSLPVPEPDGDGWLALSRKLAQEAPPPRRWRRWVLLPAMGTVAIASVIWLQRGRGPSDDMLLSQAEAEFRSAEAQYQRAVGKLVQVVEHARTEWPEARAREYDAARAALEAATEQCRKVAQSQPADPEAEEMLFAAYRKQIHFYQEQILK